MTSKTPFGKRKKNLWGTGARAQKSRTYYVIYVLLFSCGRGAGNFKIDTLSYSAAGKDIESTEGEFIQPGVNILAETRCLSRKLAQGLCALMAM